MAEQRIDQIPDTLTQLASGDFLVVRDEPNGPTAKITHLNALPRLNIVPQLVTSQLVIDTDFVWVWDATDNLPKRVSVEDLVFGNFQNTQRTADFTLNEAASIRAQELQDTVSAITLDGNQANIGGADFLLSNFRAVDVTVNASNITMYVDGSATASATIRARRSASITVSNDTAEAIFSGG